MWSPTHVQLTVLRAKNLVRKGKGSSNAFVTIQLGKDKYQTTVLENTTEPEWEEECDLSFKDHDTNIVLTVFHRNFLGLDEFLGQVVLPLSEYGIYDSPRTRWHFLANKPGKKDDRERGELEIRLAFVVRDNSLQEAKKSLSGSFLDIASTMGQKIQRLPTRSLSLKLDRLDPRLKLDKYRSRRSTNPLTDDVGSDLSIGGGGGGKDSNENKSLRHRSMSLTRLQELRVGTSRDSVFADETDLPSITESPAKNLNEIASKNRRQRANSSSFSKLSNLVESSIKRTISVPGLTDFSSPRGLCLTVSTDEWNEKTGDLNDLTSPLDERPVPKERKSRLRRLRDSGRRHTIQEVELPDNLTEENLTSSVEKNNPSRPLAALQRSNKNETRTNANLLHGYPKEIVEQYEMMNHSDLLAMVLNQQEVLQIQEDKIKDLEIYIDNLLVRVMETSPRILQNPYRSANQTFYRPVHSFLKILYKKKDKTNKKAD